MWTRLFSHLLESLIRTDRLAVVWPDGSRDMFGPGPAGPVTIQIHDPALPRKMMFNPELNLGEAYVDGRLTIEDDDLYGLLSLLIRNRAKGNTGWAIQANLRLRRVLRGIEQYNPLQKSRQNVAHHYDLSGDLYDLFLDDDRQYSCAYFSDPSLSLEEAQAAKKAHIAAKLRIEPGMRVLDIGCGWGGMGLTLARDYGAHVTGVTLSTEQHAIARARAEQAGLAHLVDFRLQDYRTVEGPFDRIVSVGMFEHVGVPHYQEYFEKVRDLLTQDGIALIHTIGRNTPPGSTSPWIAKYIFPGGYVPAMSEAMAAVEETGMFACDVEVWRLHYAETLRHWRERFTKRIDAARALYDEKFCRMWRYYLIASELSFREFNQVVFQFQLARNQRAVPLTRDYLYPAALQEQGRHAAE